MGGSLVGWRVARIAVWGGSMAVLGLLIVAPPVGLVVFWSVLIPVAPAILMVSPGLWRNICPLASTALFPRHLDFSRRIRIEEPWQGRLQLVGVLALLGMAPMGHVLLHRNGPATVLAFSVLAVVAFVGGYLFERKSGWCSTVCPVFPIEKLYGAEPLVSVVNAHCEPCQECVSLCPDATPGVDSLTVGETLSGRAAAALITGGFAGYVWGWFQVPDWSGFEGLQHLGDAYGPPFLGLLATLVPFVILRRLIPWHHEWRLARVFGAAAIACFFWFRLPELVGMGVHPGVGVLVDLAGVLPGWAVIVMRAVTTGVIGWWLVVRGDGTRAW